MPGKPDGKGSSPGRGRGQRESPLNRPCQTAGRSGRQDHAPLAEECSLDFFREAPIGIFRGHSAGKPVLVNPAMARMLGCESPRQMLEHYRDLARDFYVRPGRRQELLDTLQQRGAVEGFECEVRRIDGETIWLRMNARIAERLDDGNFTIDGFAVDITEQKTAEARERHVTGVLRAIRNVSQLIAREQAPETLIARTCRELTAVGGYRAAWIGLTDETGRLTHTAEVGLEPDSNHAADSHAEQDVPAGEVGCLARLEADSVTVKHEGEELCPACPLRRAADGCAIFCAALWHAGRRRGAVAVALDARFAGDAEEIDLFRELAGDLSLALHTLETEQAMESAAKFPSENPSPVLRIDSEGAVVYANPPAETLLAARGSKVGGPAPPPWRERSERLLKLAKPGTVEVEDQERIFAFRAVPIPARGYVNWYGNDITEQRRIEQHLLHARKMEAVGQLAGGVAHDFRNQITIVKWCAERLLRMHLVSREAREEVEEILKATESAKSLTDQLLTLGQEKSLCPDAVDIHAFARETRPALAAILGPDISLALDCERPAGDEDVRPCVAWVDPGSLRQAVVNLALNARDAMPSGGTLTIRTRCVHLDEEDAEFRGVAPGTYAVLAVSDTGTGMDADTRARVFDPFFTTKKPGHASGLGLTMVYGFVTQSGGFIDLVSRPGEGTTFALHFPTASTFQNCPAEEYANARPRWES